MVASRSLAKSRAKVHEAATRSIGLPSSSMSGVRAVRGGRGNVRSGQASQSSTPSTIASMSRGVPSRRREGGRYEPPGRAFGAVRSSRGIALVRIGVGMRRGTGDRAVTGWRTGVGRARDARARAA